MLELEVFDYWEIHFVVLFPFSYSNTYILVAVNYVSNWVKAIATPKADKKTLVNFLKKNILAWFGTPRVLMTLLASVLTHSK